MSWWDTTTRAAVTLALDGVEGRLRSCAALLFRQPLYWTELPRHGAGTGTQTLVSCMARKHTVTMLHPRGFRGRGRTYATAFRGPVSTINALKCVVFCCSG